MTYELAKQLKDAGFPQGGWENPLSFYWSTYDGGASEDKPELIGAHECNFGFMEKLWAAPTLEELIEACGEKFNGLIRKGKTVWLATGGEYGQIFGDEFLIQGATPRIAAAKLWLALQANIQK